MKGFYPEYIKNNFNLRRQTNKKWRKEQTFYHRRHMNVKYTYEKVLNIIMH